MTVEKPNNHVIIWIFRMFLMYLSHQNKHLDAHAVWPGQWLHVLWQPTREVNSNLKYSNWRYAPCFAWYYYVVTNTVIMPTHFDILICRMLLRNYWSERLISVWWASWVCWMLLLRLWLDELCSTRKGALDVNIH